MRVCFDGDPFLDFFLGERDALDESDCKSVSIGFLSLLFSFLFIWNFGNFTVSGVEINIFLNQMFQSNRLNRLSENAIDLKLKYLTGS